MERAQNRKWLIITLLGIIAPTSLLTTFKLTGIMPEPPLLETIPLDMLNWQMDRASEDAIRIERRFERLYSDSEASVVLGVHICTYRERPAESPYLRRDGVSLGAYVNVSVVGGFVESLHVRYRPLDSESIVYVNDNHWAFILENVSIAGLGLTGTVASQAYVRARATGRLCSMQTEVHWVFMDEGEAVHQLNVSIEATYRNKHAYKKIVLPVLITITPDVGGTLENARYITSGEHFGCLDVEDPVDVYAVNLQQGQEVTISLTVPPNADFNLYLHDPEGVEVASSTQPDDNTENITHTATATGTWYIKVVREIEKGKGLYKINITTAEGS